MGGGRRVGVGGEGGGGKSSQVKTRGHQSPPDGPNRSTRPKGHHSGRSRVEFQAGYTQLARSTGVNVPVMVLQGCKSTPRKANQLSLAMGDMLCK